MMGHADYETANAWGKAQGANAGGGLSKQAWFIIPKIRDVDDAISAEDQNWLGEAHPEVAFTRLNADAPCAHPKRTPEGAQERIEILAAHGLVVSLEDLKGIRKNCPYRLSLDDLIDAAALTLTAAHRIDGTAWQLTDDTRDARGLRIEIWG